jgi:flagellin-specific chaperone FliS
MKYQDKAEQEDVNYAMDKVGAIFQIEIPEKDFEKVETADLVEINEKIHACEDIIRDLSVFLSNKGYSQAATYLANAKDDLFTYLRYWMKTGVLTPKVTSKLERLMREINRRIKKFAFNWSEKGAAIMTRIIIKRIPNYHFLVQLFFIITS